MNVTEALAAQFVGGLDRQIGNAVRIAKHRGKVLALSPATISNKPHPDPRLPHTVSMSHDYLMLDPGATTPPGWVLVDGEEEGEQ